MKDSVAEAGAQHVREVVDINRTLIEKALRMRCAAYLSHVKSELLMQTIFNIGESKKEVVSLAERLSNTVTELEAQQRIISQKNLQLELKNRQLEEIRAQLERSGAALSVANDALRREIAERKRVDELLRQREITLQQQAAQLREADRRKDDFLASLGHELRNALAPMHNALQLYHIQGSVPASASQMQKMMDMIARKSAYLARLADDLVDVARITQGKLDLRRQNVDLAGVIAEAVDIARPLIEARGHQLSVSLGEDPLQIEADPVRLVQVIANLLMNAAKYTEQHGQVFLKAKREAQQLVVRVRDTGVGISSELLPHVFEPFRQGRGQSERCLGGMGIGLALARSLVEMHGGTIHARSAGPGQGSEFTVRLPALAGQQGEAVHVPRGVAPCVSRRILVVEDDPDNAESFAFLLRALGHVVDVVPDGPTALAAVAQLQPQVVFLDIGLSGMCGGEVALSLRERYGKNILLVAMTGFARGRGPLISTDPNFDHYLLKPVDVSALEKILR